MQREVHDIWVIEHESIIFDNQILDLTQDIDSRISTIERIFPTHRSFVVVMPQDWPF